MAAQTVNDVLVGVTYAALSRYYFRKTGDGWQLPYDDISCSHQTASC
jgi:hypothetical protein